MPVSTGRVSSRDAEPETFIAVSTNAFSGSEIAEAGSGSGNGKVFGVERADMEGRVP